MTDNTKRGTDAALLMTREALMALEPNVEGALFGGEKRAFENGFYKARDSIIAMLNDDSGTDAAQDSIATSVDLDKLEALAREAMPGPWEVQVDERPHHRGGVHHERRIATSWEHGQLKAKYPIVTTSVGIGKEKASPPYHMVGIREEDANFIAAANPETVLALIELARRALSQPVAAKGEDPYHLDDDDEVRFPNDTTGVAVIHADRYWKLRGCEDICAALDAKPAPASPAQPDTPASGEAIEARTERIRLSHANADSKGKTQLRHEVECLLAHIALLKSTAPASPAQPDTTASASRKAAYAKVLAMPEGPAVIGPAPAQHVVAVDERVLFEAHYRELARTRKLSGIRDENFTRTAGGYSHMYVGAWWHGWRSRAALAQQAAAHPDDIAVDHFAAAMKVKLAKKRDEGRGGWNTSACSDHALARMLMDHTQKGDPVDVANFAMMLHQRNTENLEMVAPIIRAAANEFARQAAPAPAAAHVSGRDAKDAARLDFLDTNAHKFRMGWKVGAAPVGNISVQSIIMGGKPIREAIDAAMAAAGAAGQEGGA
jgi:hypothetical protein